MSLQFHTFHGNDVESILDELAELRITVFREYPYLYDGTVEYEKEYLKAYINCPDSIVVLVRDSEKTVGATTGLPLAAADGEFQDPFLRNDTTDVNDFFYNAESVLLPEYRGQGMGHRFFEERETHAASLPGLTHTCFCAVERPADHPARPDGYRDLDPFWTARGYLKREDLKTAFPWREIGEAEETMKPMVFWTKELVK